MAVSGSRLGKFHYFISVQLTPNVANGPTLWLLITPYFCEGGIPGS